MVWILTIWAFAQTTTLGSIRALSFQEIPPDHVRIQGNIINYLAKPSGDDLCQNYPCWALVAVTNVNGYGAGFRGALSTGDTIEILFKTTLMPTESISMNRDTHLPGLSTGDSFMADMKQPLNLLETKPLNYEIEDYQKLNN